MRAGDLDTWCMVESGNTSQKLTIGGSRVPARWQLVIAGLLVAGIAYGVVSHKVGSVLGDFAWLSWAIIRIFAPAATVTAAGIRLPWRTRKALIRWDDVESVSYDAIASRAAIILHTGKRVYFAAREDQVDAIAAAGGKPRTKASYQLSPPAPPRQVGAVTRTVDPERDLQNRAARLAAENARMTAELERIQQRRPRSVN